MKKIVISIFGSGKVGKSSLIERCKPVCPYCVYERAKKAAMIVESPLSEEEIQEKHQVRKMFKKCEI
jgi:hypothetical protein